MEDLLKIVNDSFINSIETKRAFLEMYKDRIVEVGLIMAQALLDGNKILFFGNGGSAADSQHLAAEIVGRYKKERKGLPSIALTTDTSILTAVGNDYGFDVIFERQIEALCMPGDVAIGISTSGNSPNVIKGLMKAHDMGATTIAFSGKQGGKVVDIAHYSFVVPSYDTARIQECHITLGHTLCEIIDEVVNEKLSMA
ncbi:MAG: D-sedoheptulose 7-phosphate isomerase [Hydrogenobaculum sp.]|jgi:phosphoheptose isomerase (EC 5.3.1.-)|uniref:D-sedoheptulose 7-phosphate isomerase n=1 Tax=unclassified Hydrogenobaculum TaxID=2622382 RepID=UPI0001C50A76|nr:MULTISPECIES: D-sedoheptulose 7-phosphate isomerase [unclassified Hydrogenobaculum]AEF19728.1 sugar isomerase (SIS) [Hydrogenobaculum sp. 3684]AEG47015.1 Phosphoheptose isomerase [Hydrogenobaculum sp. SHO]AGG15663.1 phosphoheptose isomerase [Hydrogenobaculum sp. HO]AGH93962.1 phosphoheptose isomerase [Hydrogenobaculum sp. SN]